MLKKIISLIIVLLMTAPFGVVIATNRENKNEIHSAKDKVHIKGIVLDENNLPLPGVTVQVFGTNIAVGTRSNGEFIISFREKKQISLLFSFVGYESQKVKINSSDFSSLVKIKLLPSNNELNEVVVTGVSSMKPLKEAPVLTRVISTKEITAINPISFENLLQYQLPGLQIGYNSMSKLPTITYQGAKGDAILFLMDGEPISGEGASGNIDFNLFDINNIEKIEVIKGAQSTAYGSNAMGAVINIISKRAIRPFNADINLRYDALNGTNLSLSSSIKRSYFSSLSSLSFRHRPSYEIGDEEEKQNIVDEKGNIISSNVLSPAWTKVYGSQNWNAMQKFSVNLSDNLKLDLKGTYYRSKNDQQDGQAHNNIFSDYSIASGFKYNRDNRHFANLSNVFDSYQKDKHYNIAGFENRRDYQNIKNISRAEYILGTKSNSLKAGFEYKYEYLKHYRLKDSASTSNNTYALFLTDEWKITNDFHLNTGMRLDYHSNYGIHTTPKVSTLYKVWKDYLNIRLAYSHGFRSPSLRELYEEYDMGGLGIFTIHGNKDLKPEITRQYSLSLESTISGLNMSISGYRNEYKNKIILAQIPSGDMQYLNSEKATTMGIDAMIRWQIGKNINLSTSYAYVYDDQKYQGVNLSPLRPHSLNFNAMYNKSWSSIHLSLSTNWQWSSAFNSYILESNNKFTEFRHDARLMASLHSSLTYRGIKLGLGIDNLLNYKDKAKESTLQLPQQGISFVASLGLNIADLLKL